MEFIDCICHVQIFQRSTLIPLSWSKNKCLYFNVKKLNEINNDTAKVIFAEDNEGLND